MFVNFFFVDWKYDFIANAIKLWICKCWL